MALHSLSGLHLNWQDPLDWLEDATSSFQTQSDGIKSVAVAGGLPPKKFRHFTLEEVDAHFIERSQEADRLATLSLLASAEASLRIDFSNRVRRRVKQGRALNDLFRDAFKSRESRIRLQEDILDHWKAAETSVANQIGVFGAALPTRHWLAHGRYWTFKEGTLIDSVQASLVVGKLFGALRASPSGFFPEPT